HRYVGSILGMLIIGIVYMAWRYRRELGRSPALAVTTLVAVCVQGAFGAWTVTHKLMPAVVTAHLVFGLSVLVVVIVGGLDSVAGALVGGIFIGLLEAWAGAYLGGEYKLLATFVVLVAVLMMRPYGLFGTREIERL
ncbi:COX15/CtaA family protein, partial [Achromobacter xylosoxidans]